MKPLHVLEALGVQGLAATVRALPWRTSLGVGEWLGRRARSLGVRRRIAEENIARAFPERAPVERDRILRAHYAELGRVVCEYPRLPELARSPLGRYVAELRGRKHLEAVRGQGAVLLTGHFGNFELLGAFLGHIHATDFVVKPLTNPYVERTIGDLRAAARIGQIPVGSAMRRAFQALRAGRWVALLADQDARKHGVFVPFFGQPTSTPVGPARLALRAGVPILPGFIERRPDGRHAIEVLPPMELPEVDDPDPERTLTARHAALLEGRIRRYPEMWFWLHRRWKTRPPAISEG
ncbi:MAG TPA: lysophospholipid acyltransferase family protein [Candidatus Limnocylindria bacterium]|nr:lysophospholipid acyltransferase family protein [Candidatus Limnocylindria bacterium]